MKSELAAQPGCHIIFRYRNGFSHGNVITMILQSKYFKCGVAIHREV